jgi:uncharacterized protein YdeI (YjbR/CyaY-like superfamily)
MTIKPLSVDDYLSQGCGRCRFGGTPECKVHPWRKELQMLRQLMLDSGLVEEIKWGVPCYCLEGKNIAVVAALKDFCSLSFFKGAGLPDPQGILEKPGPNSQAARLVKITSCSHIEKLRPALMDLITLAIALEGSGFQPPKQTPDAMEQPQELLDAFRKEPDFQRSFEALTPGRQRGYLLHFAGARQSKTRADRIEKHRARILEGLGLHDTP